MIPDIDRHEDLGIAISEYLEKHGVEQTKLRETDAIYIVKFENINNKICIYDISAGINLAARVYQL